MILQAFIRGAIVILVAALLSVLLRNRSAALRHHIWATAVVVQLALLAFIPVLPKLRLPIIPTVVASFDAPVETSGTGTRTRTGTGLEEAVSGSTIRDASSGEKPVRVPVPENDRVPVPDNWPLAIWLTGAALILIRYLLGTALMMRTAYKGRRVDDGEWLVLAQRVARELEITRPVTMIWGEKLSVPITWGIVYPMILLPDSARDWPLERRRFVLVHEMAHVKRFDALTQLLAQFTAAIFWFSPFVWIAEWRMRIEREHACDDTVIQHGTEATLYAGELLQMVRSLVRRRATQPAFAALAMARKSEFEGRMLAILDPERPRTVTGISSAVAFAVLSLLIAAPVAAIDPFAVRVVTEAMAPAQSPVIETPAMAVKASQDCAFQSDVIGTTVNVTDRGPDYNIKLEREDHCAYGDFDGFIEFSPDDKRILAVRPGARAIVREVTRHGETALRIERTSAGAVSRSFMVNGFARDDDGSTERRWLARVLPELLREGAIDPAERIARLLKSNGLAGTLKDITEIRSPASRRAHFIALIRANKWSDAERARIADTVNRSLSGTEREGVMELLPNTKTTTVTTSPTEKAVVKTDVELLDQVMLGLTSSYDLRMAMQSQLLRADRQTLLIFARHASRISSGYDLAEFLLASKIQFLHHKDDGLAAAWFNAVPQITSSYDRRRVLTNVLEYVQGSEPRTLMWLKATTTMSSGSEKAAALAALAKAHLVYTPALRSAFLAEVNTLSSSTDRRTVLEALQ